MQSRPPPRRKGGLKKKRGETLNIWLTTEPAYNSNNFSLSHFLSPFLSLLSLVPPPTSAKARHLRRQHFRVPLHNSASRCQRVL